MKYIRTEDTIKPFDGPYHGNEPWNLSSNVIDLIDEVISLKYITPCVVGKWLWEDDVDFDPEQEEMYGAIWVTGDNGAPMLKPVIKKTEIGKWEFI